MDQVWSTQRHFGCRSFSSQLHVYRWVWMSRFDTWEQVNLIRMVIWIIVAIRHCFQTKLMSDLPRHHLKLKDYSEVAIFHSSLTKGKEAPLASRRPSLRSRSRVGDSSVIPLEPIPGETLKKRFNVEVTFKVFAPVVFASLRAALGIRHEDYLEVNDSQRMRESDKFE